MLLIDTTTLNLVNHRLHVWDQVIAELDYSRGLNGELVLQLAEDAVTSATAGWALVETEPIKYSLQVASNTEYISCCKHSLISYNLLL